MSGVPARVGVLGGTFDPIHEAHLLVAHAVRDALPLDQVIFMPAGDPWRKAGEAITPAQHRLAAVRAAVEAAADRTFIVSDAEVRRPGPTYTVDTLRELQGNGRTLWFILGADALLDLPHWHAADELVRLARLALVPRPGQTVDLDALDRLVPGLKAAVDEVPMTPVDLSATELRETLREGGPLDGVPAGAREYIEGHGLYRSAPG